MTKKSVFNSHTVRQAQQGDDLARNELLEALQPLLRAFFIKRIGLKPEVDDLIQNTLLRVHRGLSHLKDPSSLRAFAMKAALFELQDMYRGRYGTKERLYDPDRAPEHSLDDSAASTRFDLEQALSTLSPKARRILELREYGYRYEEIANMIGSTEAAIKMQVKRSFARLRKILMTVIGFLLP